MEQKPQNSTRAAVFILIGLIAVIVLIGFIPAEDAGGKFWFMAIGIFFAILLFIGVVYGWLQKRMVQEMKATSAAGTKLPDLPREESSVPPPCPFEYKVYDRNTPIQMSPVGEKMLTRVKSLNERQKPNMMYSALFIWGWYLPIAGMYTLTPNVLPASTLICCGIIPTLLVAWVIANPKKASAEMVTLIWGGLNVVGIGVILIGMFLTAFHIIVDRGTFTRTSDLFAILALSVVALLAYALFNGYLGSRLRHQTAATKPMRLLILWVFGPQKNLLTLLGNIGQYWRLIGSVQFLQGGAYTLNMNQVVSYISGKRDILTATREQLDKKLHAFKYIPERNGTYPSHSLLCGDAVWKLAIDYFLQNSDMIAMNLCGFSRSNQGCIYELSLLTDRFPSRRILFLVDDTTDMDFLTSMLKQKWNTMPAASPNHTTSASAIRIYKLFSSEIALEEALRTVDMSAKNKTLGEYLKQSNVDLNTLQSQAVSDNENLQRLFFEVAAS